MYRNVTKEECFKDIGNISELYIIQNSNIPSNHFLSFQNMRGTANAKLDHLISIRDKWLREPLEPPYRMTAV